MRRLTLLPLLCAALVGCAADDAQDSPSSTQTDSSGVTIVHSMRPSWPEGAGWQLAAEPTLRIGEEEGAAEYLFSRVRGARIVDDTVLVVADGGSNQLRFFDLTGRFRFSVGREGQGPGEFEYLYGLPHCYSDSIVAADISDRLSVFTKSGEFVRVLQMYGTPERQISPYQFACGLEGIAAVNGWGSAMTDDENLFFVSHSHVYVGSLTDQAMVDLGEFIASERWATQSGGVVRGNRPHPFGRQTRLAVGGGEVYVGTSESHEVMVFDTDGTLQRLIRWDGVDLTLSAEVANTYYEWEVQRAPAAMQAAMRGDFRDMPLPGTRPSFSELMIDHAGNLWAREFNPIRDAPQRWIVFDDSGAWLGRMTLPSRLTTLEVFDDRIVGVERDDLDVERVVVYELLK